LLNEGEIFEVENSLPINEISLDGTFYLKMLNVTTGHSIFSRKAKHYTKDVQFGVYYSSYGNYDKTGFTGTFILNSCQDVLIKSP
jgi:hypothetical protein